MTNLMSRAQQHARQSDHDEVEDAHILLAILDDPELLAVRAMLGQHPDINRLRTTATRSGGTPGEGGRVHLPVSKSGKRLLEGALRQTLRLGHSDVGAEHILLSMLSDATLPTHRVLQELGIDVSVVKTFVIDERSTGL